MNKREALYTYESRPTWTTVPTCWENSDGDVSLQTPSSLCPACRSFLKLVSIKSEFNKNKRFLRLEYEASQLYFLADFFKRKSLPQ